ncbi:MAG: DUF4124 domain-containing protein [Gammaproteobacteria bacterium]
MKNLVGITIGLVLSVPAAAGSVYRWVDEQGQVHFGDKPPAGATVTQKEVRPATGDDRATGGGLRSGELARLGEIRKQESRMAAEKRDRDERVAADEKRRARQAVQDAKRCAGYQQKIGDYKRGLRAGCRVSTCNSYNDQLARYKSKAALVCR